MLGIYKVSNVLLLSCSLTGELCLQSGPTYTSRKNDIHGYSSRALGGVFPTLVACHIISRHYKSRARNNMAVRNQRQWQTLFSNNLAFLPSFLAQLRRKFAN